MIRIRLSVTLPITDNGKDACLRVSRVIRMPCLPPPLSYIDTASRDDDEDGESVQLTDATPTYDERTDEFRMEGTFLCSGTTMENLLKSAEALQKDGWCYEDLEGIADEQLGRLLCSQFMSRKSV